MTNLTTVRIDTAAIAWPEPVAIAADRVIHGAPVASTLVLDDTSGHQLGLWRVSAGEFTTDHAGYREFIHILEGSGTLIDDDGTQTSLAPGVAVFMAAGWRGRWVVDETITKVFTVIHS